MPIALTDILSNVDAIVASLTVLFPGFLAYFVYIGCRAADFDELNRRHIILVLFFTLLFQIISDISGPLMDSPVYRGVFYFIMPVVFGAVADLAHRLFVTGFVSFYQERIIDGTGKLELIDVGNVSRWQKTVRSYVEDGLGDVTKEYYVEVDLLNPDGGEITKRGFLNGYSDDDIELLRYDDLSNKDFPEVGDPDLDPDKLTMTVELIPRSNISSLRIYRVKMEDFKLK